MTDKPYSFGAGSHGRPAPLNPPRRPLMMPLSNETGRPIYDAHENLVGVIAWAEELAEALNICWAIADEIALPSDVKNRIRKLLKAVEGKDGDR